MKKIVCVLRSLAFVTVLSLPLAAQGQLTWGTSGTGGSGTWNDTNTNWWDGGANVVWNSGSANFAGTAGTVTVSGTQNVTAIGLNTAFYVLQGGAINFTGGSPTLAGSGNGQTISSVLRSTNGLSISGGGKTISGNNVDLDGIIAFGTGAVVRLNSSNALGDSGAFADRVTMQGSGLFQLSAGVTVNKYITTTGANTIEAIGNSTLTGAIVPGGSMFMQLDPGATLTLSGSAGMGQAISTFQLTSTGRLIVDAPGGSISHAVQIRGSTTLQLNNVTNPVGPAGTNIFIGEVAGDPTLSLNGATVSNNLFLSQFSATRKIENMSAGMSIYAGQILPQSNIATVLRSTTSGTLRVSGNIGDGANTASFEIGGSGTNANAGVVEFSRSVGNAYDGGTSINSGTLLVNNTTGSATGTGVVTVASGATLGGAGIISGVTTVNGSIAPGNGIGTLTIQNDLTWNGGLFAASATDWKFQLGPSDTEDLLAITGAGSDFLKGTGSAFRFDFQGTGTLGTFVLVDWAGTTNFLATDFTYTNLGSGMAGSFAFNGSQLEFTVIPEPSVVALVVAGAGLLVMRRRRA